MFFSQTPVALGAAGPLAADVGGLRAPELRVCVDNLSEEPGKSFDDARLLACSSLSIHRLLYEREEEKYITTSGSASHGISYAAKCGFSQ